MNGRTAKREVLVGVVVVAAIAGLLALLVDGRRRARLPRPAADDRRRSSATARASARAAPSGSPGSTPAASSTSTSLEYEGALSARVRISAAGDLAKKLRQDVKITIQPSLTGQSRVNIVSSGRSAVALVPGAGRPGGRVHLLRPDPRTGRARARRAEPPQPHDRRGPRHRRQGRARGSGRSSPRSRRRPAASTSRPRRSGRRSRRPPPTSRTSRSNRRDDPEDRGDAHPVESLTARPTAARREPDQPPGHPRQRPRPDRHAPGRRGQEPRQGRAPPRRRRAAPAAAPTACSTRPTSSAARGCRC